MSKSRLPKSCALALSVVAAALLPLSLLAAPAVKPLGRQFQVNITADDGDPPSVATDPLGNALVVWNGAEIDGAGRGIFAVAIDENFRRGSEPVRIDASVNSIVDAPAVAVAASGDSVVVWESTVEGSGDTNIVARRFDFQGRPKDTQEFIVDSTADSILRSPAVAMDPDGEFVIVWENVERATTVTSIRARRFASTGDLSGAPPEFVVATTDDQALLDPAVAMSARGEYVVVWLATVGFLDSDIRGRAFNGGGPVGADFAVANATADEQSLPAVAINVRGEYVVAWQDSRTASGAGIFARRFGFPDRPRGDQVLVRDNIAQPQRRPGVSIDARGRFIVVWEATFRQPAIEGRLFRANGRPLGREFRISDSEDSGAAFEGQPRVALDADGDFTVAWSAFTPNASVTNNILARRFRGPEEIDLAARIRGRFDEGLGLRPTLKYKATVTNLHPVEALTGIVGVDAAIGAARDVTVVLTLPGNVAPARRIDFDPPEAGRCGRAENPRAVVCRFAGPLRSGHTANLKFRLTPLQAGNYTAEVEVLSPRLDPDESNDREETVTNVPALPP